MEFSAGRLFGGLGISLAGIAVVYLYYQVLHVMPRLLLVGAMLAVPLGLLFAASCWTETTTSAPRPRPVARANVKPGSRR
jgi:membrane-associated PAP2 superfamily phosphatase